MMSRTVALNFGERGCTALAVYVVCMTDGPLLKEELVEECRLVNIEPRLGEK